MAMFERAAVIDADMAEDMSGHDLPGTQRGDDIFVLQTTEERFHLHLRREMEPTEIADGLRQFADLIEDSDMEV